MPFVVLGNFASGTHQVETSPDGITWTSHATPSDPSGGFALCFGNGRYVAVCFAPNGTTSIAMTSTDGVTWASHSIPQPNAQYNGVTWSAALGLFVAIDTVDGTSAFVITSPDGANWTQSATITQGATGVGLLTSICAGPSLLVAVSDSSASGKVVATSPDGVTWTNRLGAGTGKDWNAVTFGGGQFVAVCSTSTSHQIMTSPDGITWTLQVTPTPRQEWFGLCFGNGLYVAVGNPPTGPQTSQIMTSPDGVTWTKQTTPAGTLPLTGVFFGNAEYLAVGFGTGGNNVLTSPDGVTWTLQTSAIPDLLQAVVFGPASPSPTFGSIKITFRGVKRTKCKRDAELVQMPEVPHAEWE